MRTSLIAAALASTVIASPAMAREGAMYVELDAGVMFLEDFDIDVNGVDNAAILRHDPVDLGVKVDGYDFGGIIGYDFGAFRLEAEGAYKGVRSGDLTIVGPGGGTFDTDGDSNALSFMANALLDFGPDDGLQGYIGGGAGWARISHDISDAAGTVIDDSDSGFAWQAIAGIRAPLTDSVDVGIKYRFFNANTDFDDGVDVLESRWRSHSVMGTLTFNFGGAAPAYEPAPPPPPPPPMRPAERG